MPTEQEHLEHIKSVLKQRKTQAQQEAERLAKELKSEILRLQEQIQQIEAIQQSWRGLANHVAGESPPDIERGGAPITESITNYLQETGKTEFGAADIKKYLEGQGYSGKWLYNSIYETLTRWVHNKRLVRSSGKFALPCEHGNPKGRCEPCQTTNQPNLEK